MMELEEESYKRTITNQAKVQIRERLTELLPELVTAVQTKSNVHAHLMKIDDDTLRKKLFALAKKFKI